VQERWQQNLFLFPVGAHPMYKKIHHLSVVHQADVQKCQVDDLGNAWFCIKSKQW